MWETPVKKGILVNGTEKAFDFSFGTLRCGLFLEAILPTSQTRGYLSFKDKNNCDSGELGQSARKRSAIVVKNMKSQVCRCHNFDDEKEYLDLSISYRSAFFFF
jgi:hypothetical protein